MKLTAAILLGLVASAAVARAETEATKGTNSKDAVNQPGFGPWGPGYNPGFPGAGFPGGPFAGGPGGFPGGPYGGGFPGGPFGGPFGGPWGRRLFSLMASKSTEAAANTESTKQFWGPGPMGPGFMPTGPGYFPSFGGPASGAFANAGAWSGGGWGKKLLSVFGARR